MLKFLVPLALTTAVAAPVPATAQDLGGAVDLGALSRSQVQSATARGYAERGGARTSRGPNGVVLSAKSRAYCDAFPSYRRQYGNDDPRVGRLAAACRQAGYRY